jgi:hypothetical protein
MSKVSLICSAAIICFASVAQASTLTFSAGPGTGEAAINLTGGAGLFSTTGTIAGGDVVDFSSTQQVDFANGVATVSVHGNGTFSNLTVSVPTGFTFSDIDFGALFTGGTGGTVTATDQSGSSTSTTIGSGLQELVLTSSGALTSLTLSSPTGFSQLKQFEISGLTATPLPAALPLFAGGLGLMGFLARRRKAKAAA